MIIEFGTGRDPAINGVLRVMLLIDQAKLQRGRRAEDLLGAGGVLHAGQLHHHPVQPLLLDDRFRHAQFIDPLAQRSDVLLQGQPPDFKQHFLPDHRAQL